MSTIVDDMYTIENICEKLRTLRVYRGYKSQSKISQELGIPKQSWNLWERGSRNPGLANISDICNFLSISPLFFFSQEADIARYDERNPPPDEYRLPFVKTKNTLKIERLLNAALNREGIYLIETPGEAGVSRGISEWLRARPDKHLLIFDHAERLSHKNIKQNCNAEKGISKVFVLPPGENNWPREIPHTARTQCLPPDYDDFKKIILAALPQASLPVISILLTETGYSLHQLSRVIKRIEQKQKNPNWQLDFHSVIKLCDSLKTNI